MGHYWITTTHGYIQKVSQQIAEIIRTMANASRVEIESVINCITYYTLTEIAVLDAMREKIVRSKKKCFYDCPTYFR